MKCANCNMDIEKGTKFCPNCGQEQKKMPFYKVKWCLVSSAVALTLMLVVIGMICFNKTKHTKTADQNQTEKDFSDSGKREENEKTENGWSLFQENTSSYALTKEEKEWALACVKQYAASVYEAEFLSHSISYQICSNGSWKDGMVTVFAAVELTDALFPQYTNKVQYIQMEFQNEKEPKMTEISFGLGEEESSFTKAKASSVCNSQHNQISNQQELCEYGPQNVLDMDSDTAWIEGKKGYGIGESITVSAGKEKTIYGIALKNGYIKSQRTLERNAQAKEITVHFSDGSKETYQLKKNVYGTGVSDWYSDCIIFDEPIRTKSVKMTIDSVYPSKTYYEQWDDKNMNGEPCKDTCISEVMVLESPENLAYETLSETDLEDDDAHYENWQEAYSAVLDDLDGTMKKYNSAMKQYVDEYSFFHGSIEYRYDEDGYLYLPNGGLLTDINQDKVPELCLVSAGDLGDGRCGGNYGEGIIHVFTYEYEKAVYCGSIVTRFDDEGKVRERDALEGKERYCSIPDFHFCNTVIYQNLETGELCTRQCNACEDAMGQLFYNNFTIEENRLVRSQCAKFEYYVDEKREAMAIVHNWNIDFVSVKESEYQRLIQTEKRYQELPIRTLSDLAEEILEGE